MCCFLVLGKGAFTELSMRQIAETTNTTGMKENKVACKVEGRIAKKARIELENKTGKKWLRMKTICRKILKMTRMKQKC